jgi:hypothetical protein
VAGHPAHLFLALGVDECDQLETETGFFKDRNAKAA